MCGVGFTCTWVKQLVRLDAETGLWHWVFRCRKCHRRMAFTSAYAPSSRSGINRFNNLQNPVETPAAKTPKYGASVV